jgi:hypothetical protein
MTVAVGPEFQLMGDWHERGAGALEDDVPGRTVRFAAASERPVEAGALRLDGVAAVLAPAAEAILSRCS